MLLTGRTGGHWNYRQESFNSYGSVVELRISGNPNQQFVGRYGRGLDDSGVKAMERQNAMVVQPPLL